MYKFESYHVDLFRHEELDSDLLACHETDDPMNEHLTITFDDSVRWLTFFNRSYGYYCVVVTPDDARCNPSLVVDLDTTCTRHSNIVELRGLIILISTLCVFTITSIDLFFYRVAKRSHFGGSGGSWSNYDMERDLFRLRWDPSSCGRVHDACRPIKAKDR